jgi:hypothetical protein
MVTLSPSAVSASWNHSRWWEGRKKYIPNHPIFPRYLSQGNYLHKKEYMVVNFTVEKSGHLTNKNAFLTFKYCLRSGSFIKKKLSFHVMYKYILMLRRWKCINFLCTEQLSALFIKSGDETWLYIMKFTNIFILLLEEGRWYGIHKRDRKLI